MKYENKLRAFVEFKKKIVNIYVDLNPGTLEELIYV